MTKTKDVETLACLIDPISYRTRTVSVMASTARDIAATLRTLAAENETLRAEAEGAAAIIAAERAEVMKLRAERDAAQGVTVRRLEWRPDSGYSVPVDGIYYSVFPSPTGTGQWRVVRCALTLEGDVDGPCVVGDGFAVNILPDAPALEDGKAAAQADYERRILSAIEPAPISVWQAARVVHEAFTSEECEFDFKPGWKAYAKALKHDGSIYAGMAAFLRAIAQGEGE